jgi:hypothetical protein
MKTLIVGKPVEQVNQSCNWCREKKECFKATVPQIFFYWQSEENLEWLKKRGWREPEQLYWVRKGDRTLEEKSRYPAICSDCVKQLAKF